jgi:hypothetical protein
MPASTPKSIATSGSSFAADTARACGLLADRLAEKAHPAYALTPVCFTAISASATEGPDGLVLTFATHDGKSVQVLLNLPADKAAAFRSDLIRSIRRRRRPFPPE